MSHTTLRRELEKAGFDFTNGVIVYQAVIVPEGWDAEDVSRPGWAMSDEVSLGVIIDNHHPILDQEYSDGRGAPSCPRFFARDNLRVYFPAQYVGATWIEAINLDPAHYTEPNIMTPYPGGS